MKKDDEDYYDRFDRKTQKEERMLKAIFWALFCVMILTVCVACTQ